MQVARVAIRVMGSLVGLTLLALWGYFRASDRTNGRMVTSLGEERRYILHVPSGHDPSTPVSLVISLHGFADWPAHHMEMTRWNALAEREGFLVVYPSGLRFPKRWRIVGATAEETRADVVFVSELIDRLEGDYRIDPKRIYVNGMSNGGAMAFLLACEMPDRIASIGIVAGAMSLEWGDCQMGRPVPAILFHGTADPIVPYAGGPSRGSAVPFPDVPTWVRTLAERNGCAGDAVPFAPGEGVRGASYTGCTADVTMYTIDGGGHTWPGGVPLPTWIAGATSDGVDATEAIWAFYAAHPLE